ncbi:MAG: hypothetical protein ACI3W8_06905 [Oscillospiraceae bacterium]
MKKVSFSKVLLIMESILVLYTTYEGFQLAHEAIAQNYLGALPWVATMVTAAWGAYGTSVAFYYNKSKAENSKGGIVYDAALGREETV